MELYQIEYFIAIAEEGSLLKASERLHVSQPSLSRAMQNLEADLGINLFNRSKNKITLNKNGEEILALSYSLLAVSKRIEDKAKEIKANEEILRIGMSAPGPFYRYPYLFNPTSLNKVDVEIEEEEKIIQKIKDGIYDIGFINSPLEDPSIETRKLFVEHLFVWIPKNHFLAQKKDGIYYKDIDGQSFLLSNNLGVWDGIAKSNLPNSKFYEQNASDLLEIVEASSICAFVTDVIPENDINSQRIRIPILDENAYLPFYLIFRKKNKAKFQRIISAIN